MSFSENCSKILQLMNFQTFLTRVYRRMYGHSKVCVDAFKEYEVRIVRFKEKYPYCCTVCNGTGGIGYICYDTGGYSSFDLCSECEGAEGTIPKGV